MTLAQLEINLGLRRVYLATGASIYRFARLPLVTEYEYELTAEFSGGLAYNPASGDGAYGPGSRTIPRWRIRFGVQIPVDPDSMLDLKPGQMVPANWVDWKVGILAQSDTC